MEFGFMDVLVLAALIAAFFMGLAAFMKIRDSENEETDLYHKILAKGCENCGSDFTIDLTITSYLYLSCKECDSKYRISPEFQLAEKLTD